MLAPRHMGVNDAGVRDAGQPGSGARRGWWERIGGESGITETGGGWAGAIWTVDRALARSTCQLSFFAGGHRLLDCGYRPLHPQLDLAMRPRLVDVIVGAQ